MRTDGRLDAAAAQARTSLECYRRELRSSVTAGIDRATREELDGLVSVLENGGTASLALAGHSTHNRWCRLFLGHRG